jgi:hypothetical protein
VVQFCTFIFHVAASVLYRLDGRERIGTTGGGLLCRSFLPGKRDVHLFEVSGMVYGNLLSYLVLKFYLDGVWFGSKEV